jgi:hypothetical protein
MLFTSRQPNPSFSKLGDKQSMEHDLGNNIQFNSFSFSLLALHSQNLVVYIVDICVQSLHSEYKQYEIYTGC